MALPDVKVLAVEADRDRVFVSHVEQHRERPPARVTGGRAVMDRDPVNRADRGTGSGRAGQNRECPVGSRTWRTRAAMIDQALGGVTVRADRLGCTVAEVVVSLEATYTSRTGPATPRGSRP
jgi:hypothetical protein